MKINTLTQRKYIKFWNRLTVKAKYIENKHIKMVDKGPKLVHVTSTVNYGAQVLCTWLFDAAGDLSKLQTSNLLEQTEDMWMLKLKNSFI